MKEKTKLNLWKNSHSVIQWFKALENKTELTFILFDVCEFYPNISEALLKKAIAYAKNYEKITAEETKIIFQTKKAFLFKDGKPWTKKGNKSFDVSMGSWDGAEVCELVGLYLLSLLSDLQLTLGLYRDDGL